MKGYLLISVLAFTLAACTEGISKESETNENKHTEETQEIIQNEELTKSIIEEEGITGQAYEQDGLAVGTFSLESDVSDEDVKKC